MKSFFESQFGFYSLIWMFHGRGVNNGINNLHEHLLRKVYKDSNSSFKDLLKNDNSFTVHHKNFQSLAIELLKVKQNLSNKIMIDISQTRELTHNLRSQTYFVGSFRSQVKGKHAAALEFQHFLPRQIKCRGNYMKIHFALALPRQCFCRGWQDFILRASAFTSGTSAKTSTRSKLVRFLPLLHISPRIRSIMYRIQFKFKRA